MRRLVEDNHYRQLTGGLETWVWCALEDYICIRSSVIACIFRYHFNWQVLAGGAEYPPESGNEGPISFALLGKPER